MCLISEVLMKLKGKNFTLKLMICDEIIRHEVATTREWKKFILCIQIDDDDEEDDDYAQWKAFIVQTEQMR